MSTTSATAPRSYPGGLSRRQVVAWRNAVFLVFALCGVAFASWAGRIPAVRDSLGASTEQLGVLLAGIAVGSVVGLILSGHIIASFGARTVMAVALFSAMVGLAVVGIGATSGMFWVVFGGLVIFGAGSGICDVAMNVSGAANERVLERAIMPIFHAFFSFGTMLGAGLGALAELADISLALHLGVVAVIVAGAVLIAVRRMQSEHVIEDAAEESTHTTWRERLSIWRDSATLLVGLIVLGAAFAEGSANDWLALAMVDGHGLDRELGAVVLGVFLTAMTVGRLLGVKLLDRYGRVPVLRGSFALAAVGLLVLILVPNPVVATLGAVAWGLGAALGFPVGMSAAADDPRKAAARVSAVATIGYCAFLVGPPAIGFLGEQIGILNALLVTLVLVAVGGLVSNAAREPKA